MRNIEWVRRGIKPMTAEETGADVISEHQSYHYATITAQVELEVILSLSFKLRRKFVSGSL
jgi:hypothetical protein